MCQEAHQQGNNILNVISTYVDKDESIATLRIMELVLAHENIVRLETRDKTVRARRDKYEAAN